MVTFLLDITVGFYGECPISNIKLIFIQCRESRSITHFVALSKALYTQAPRSEITPSYLICSISWGRSMVFQPRIAKPKTKPLRCTRLKILEKPCHSISIYQLHSTVPVHSSSPTLPAKFRAGYLRQAMGKFHRAAKHRNLLNMKFLP